MEISREYLDATLSNLNAQKEEFYANFQRCDGAIKLCEAMLARLDHPEPEEKEKSE